MPNGLPAGVRAQPGVIQNGSVPVGMNGIPMGARVHPQTQMRAPMTAEQMAQLRTLHLKQQQQQQAAAQGQSYSQAGMQGFPAGAVGSRDPAAVKALIQQAQQAALGGQRPANAANGQAGSPRMQNQQPLNPQQQQAPAG